MKARTIWSTPDGDTLIGYIARVSNPDNQKNSEITRLIRYLATHGHWSPFEMANLCVEIECSMSIAEQMIRHRSFSFQKFSFRYSDVDALGLHPSYVRARRPGKTNRQSSAGNAPRLIIWLFLALQMVVWQVSVTLYRLALRLGVPREQARFLLPAMLTTRMYVNGTVRSWIHYLKVRLEHDAQQEHRELAQQITTLLTAAYPVTMAAVFDYIEGGN